MEKEDAKLVRKQSAKSATKNAKNKLICNVAGK
jgi:hypothetical protein